MKNLDSLLYQNINEVVIDIILRNLFSGLKENMFFLRALLELRLQMGVKKSIKASPGVQ